MNFNPASCTHLEFTNTNQTITIPNTNVDQYQINSVSYKSSDGVIFDDMKITTSGNSFKYSSAFQYAVPRKVYYSMLSVDQITVTKHTVNNIVDLPKNYTAIYQVDNPADSSSVTFTVKGQQRHATESTDSITGQVTYNWGPWSSFTTTYTITLTTNMDKHMELIKNAVQNGQLVKNLQ